MAKTQRTGKGSSVKPPKAVAPKKTRTSTSRSPRAAAPKAAAPARQVGEAVRANQSEIVAVVQKGWAANGAAWTKKFNLPISGGTTSLIQMIRYGKVSLNDL